MLIKFGDTLVDTSKAATIRKNGKYISFMFGTGENISFFMEEESKVDEIYDTIVEKSGDVYCVKDNPPKKRKRGRPRKTDCI